MVIKQKYEWEGKAYSPGQLAKLHKDNISASSMRQRLAKMSVKEAMETPRKKTGRWKLKEKPEQKEVKRAPVTVARKADTTQCKTCKYRGTLGNSKGSGVFCAYALIPGNTCRSSVSPPSPNCTVYIKVVPILKTATLQQIKKGALM